MFKTYELERFIYGNQEIEDIYNKYSYIGGTESFMDAKRILRRQYDYDDGDKESYEHAKVTKDRYPYVLSVCWATTDFRGRRCRIFVGIKIHRSGE